MSETFDAAIRRGAACLVKADVDDPPRDARLLMGWAAGLDAAQLMAALRDPVPHDARARFDDAIAARAARRPVSHIVGGRMFWSRWFEVTPDVLDPRPETEIMIAAALGLSPRRVLDLGVGSGCILGTVLAECGDATGLGVDASAAALDVAARNMAALGVADRVDLLLGDWLTGIGGPFDLAVCNPPYITADEMLGLSPEVRGHEPHMALSPGGDGLAAYRAIAPALARVMAPGGRALFEIGPKQAAPVSQILAASGCPDPAILTDFDGRDRCLVVGPF